MKRELILSKQARRQLIEIDEYIAADGYPDGAERIVNSIGELCKTLLDYPYIGVTRDDLRVGLRTIPWRKKATIAYAVSDTAIEIIGIFYGGRDYESLLRDESE